MYSVMNCTPGGASLMGMHQHRRHLRGNTHHCAAPLLQRASVRVSSAIDAAAATTPAAAVDAEQAKALIDRNGYRVVDVRPAKEYEAARITKPARVSSSVPYGNGGAFAARAAAAVPASGRLSVLIVGRGGGSDGSSDSSEADAEAEAAAAALAAVPASSGSAGYAAVAWLRGGFPAYDRVWSPSGKRRPPPGRWVPTGKEALKSALNVGDAAMSYEEGGNSAVARYNARGADE